MSRSSNARRIAGLVFGLAWSIAIQTAVAQTPQSGKAILSPRVQDRTFHSKSLDRDMHYLIVLPVGYKKSQKKYPVLYLLHGWAGDYKNWVILTKVVEYSQRYPMVIVTPDAQNSWYVNSATVPVDRFEDYIVKDLVHEIDTRWRTIASPQRRSIAGLSMGGYGSILFGLKHADSFAVVGSVSGALDGPAGVEQIMPDLRESTARAYGPQESPMRIDNNIYSLLEKADRSKVPYMFLQCGSEDPFLPSNRKFADELSAKKISYEYHEYPGAHTWEFWDHSLPMLLEVVATRSQRHSMPSSAQTP
jgi:putative tributyrin esterase